MLKGDLTTTPLASLLLQLADDSATGCLHILEADGGQAQISSKADRSTRSTSPTGARSSAPN